MTVTDAGIALWIVLLVVVTCVVVPLAVSLLRRGLAASHAIEAYLADMLTAGLGIANHTSAVPALDQTIDVAVAMRPVADDIQSKTGAVAALLAARAA